MTRIYVDATPLIALGKIGELDVLNSFDGDLAVPDRVLSEVTTEPARTNVERFVDGPAEEVEIDSHLVHEGLELLGDDEPTGDAALVSVVLDATNDERDIAVVSDDMRVRTVADGLGAAVTGTAGAIIRSVEEGRDADDAAELLRRVDGNGLHMTGELREAVLDQIEGAAASDDRK